jgi:diguanylate cyclase (GGDEF)-like protein
MNQDSAANQDSVLNRDEVEVTVDRPERTWSLRREWSRAYAIMLLLLLATAVSTIVGVRGVVDKVEGTGLQLQRESTTVTTLLAEISTHEQSGHKLLRSEPVDAAAYVSQQQAISAMFDQAAVVFPAADGMRATIVAAHQSWRKGLMTSGLWDGDRYQGLRGGPGVDNPAYGASSDATRALLNGLRSSSLRALDGGLNEGAARERILIATLGGLFAAGLSLTAYFRRRMIRDLLRPLAGMQERVWTLQAGDYDSRVEVARRDELGELARTFNQMAEALKSSDQALTALHGSHDQLTGLASRTTLTERLTASFRAGSERRARQESLLIINIDDFKGVNASLGHEGGDALLTQLATRLKGCVRASPGHDLVARIGGDEFAILVMAHNDGTMVADRVVSVLKESFIIGGEFVVVDVSIGVAQRGPETADAAELLRQADFAMHMAKSGGKDGFHLFDAVRHEEMVDQSALRTALGAAVTSGQLRLEYQPVADLHTGEILGVEALVRWQHPTLGLLTPDTFIPLAEQTGDIDAIGCWVLYTATRQVAAWRQTMDHCNNMWVSVNLSALQLVNPRSLAAIQNILADATAQSDRVILEVTETALASDAPEGIALLGALRGLGVRIAIDDFGTGLSSLSTLTELNLPVDILKVDGSFISGHASVPPSGPLLEGILRLANSLSIEVIAEGIEQQEELDLLRGLGYRMGQGYLLAWPATSHALEAMLAAGGLLQLGPSAEVGGATGS